MLKISKLSDYAFRLLQSLAHSECCLLSATSLAERNRLTVPTVRKILKQLALAGIIESEQGLKGGYCLRHGLDSVSILDVIVSIDGDVNVTACAAQAGVCAYEQCCQLQTQWCWVNDQINKLLAGISLQALFSAPKTLSPPLYSAVLNLMDNEHESK